MRREGPGHARRARAARREAPSRSRWRARRAARNAPARERFRAGDRVRVTADHVPGHVRMPAYIRGKVGVVVARVAAPIRSPTRTRTASPPTTSRPTTSASAAPSSGRARPTRRSCTSACSRATSSAAPARGADRASALMLQLHYCPGNASLDRPHRPRGARRSVRAAPRRSRAGGAQVGRTYLALNPNGLIPVLVDDARAARRRAARPLRDRRDLPAPGRHASGRGAAAGARHARARPGLQVAGVVHEHAAGDAHPLLLSRSAGPTTPPAPRSSRRTPRRRSARCSTRSTPSSRATAGRGSSATRFSVVDPYAFVLCRWTRGFARPARSLPHVGPWLDRMLARPAVQRAFASEKLAAPFV